MVLVKTMTDDQKGVLIFFVSIAKIINEVKKVGALEEKKVF